uniref:Uncharacterized protein n=1 Tax=Tetraselmis sp. GSL018 TaxID=582737 RepID=A0A061S630_9CHLO
MVAPGYPSSLTRSQSSASSSVSESTKRSAKSLAACRNLFAACLLTDFGRRSVSEQGVNVQILKVKSGFV